jgi:hypothetical protein
VSASLHDDECVARDVLRRHEPGCRTALAHSADAEPAALPERVALEPRVPADDRAVRRLDRAGTARNPATDEVAEWPLADEADAGRIALVRDGQAAVARDRADFGFHEPTDRELADRKLRRAERVQEVSLVLVAVDGA